MLRRLAVLMAALMIVLTGVQVAPAAAERRALRPIVFVHGFSGSGGQFDSQARRLASNGYPPTWIEAHEYDSLFAVNTREQVYAGLDQRITRLLAATGADRIDLLGHSLGTALMQAYLNSSPERAARVAHYVNLDGASATAPPGNVPTLAVWGEGDPARAITGATNVRFPDQSHTQTVSSPETFAAFYRFFTGRDPKTTRIVPQRGSVLLAGRAVLFPSNVGVTDATLEVYAVRADTGTRLRRHPDARLPLAADGSFGPFRGRGDVRYEFAIVRPGAPVHHLYFQPFRRTDRLIRLLTSLPGQGLGALTENGPASTNLVISRQKEWWGDQGAAGDSLTVDGQEILNAATSPRSKRTIGIFTFDKGLDKTSDLSAPIPVFFSQPFISAVDLYVPAAPPKRTVRVVVRPRGGGSPDVLTVPNWPSDGHRISLEFDND
ncbi:alpha/beta hydrolase [Cryptosporangium aurantiacum]|uniref:Lipase (Class 2) n=1 Tax=Cryptosporangium aurantiacum TaxID=134849 RepID=A0A1M7L3D7_9ACTN|nr:alpha/beta hydrolase [Cryptosporangium aurantiacum]SHM72388.1 Lipase (class 2) [Cryptosporangium aurantiacum]